MVLSRKCVFGWKVPIFKNCVSEDTFSHIATVCIWQCATSCDDQAVIGILLLQLIFVRIDATGNGDYYDEWSQDGRSLLYTL